MGIAEQIWFKDHAPVCSCGCFMLLSFRRRNFFYACRSCRANCSLLAASANYKKLDDEDLARIKWDSLILGENFFVGERFKRRPVVPVFEVKASINR
jgi:hypothetical protein